MVDTVAALVVSVTADGITGKLIGRTFWNSRIFSSGCHNNSQTQQTHKKRGHDKQKQKNEQNEANNQTKEKEQSDVIQKPRYRTHVIDDSWINLIRLQLADNKQYNSIDLCCHNVEKNNNKRGIR